MSIWEYRETGNTKQLWYSSKCPYCGFDLITLKNESRRMRIRPSYIFSTNETTHKACSSCGWWVVQEEGSSTQREYFSRTIYAATASLKKFSIINSYGSIEDIRSYLLKRYDVRYEVHPKIFEDVVSSVFADLGYEVITTGYSGDGGIDVFAAKGIDIRGIQVKRYRNSIEVEQIRSLAGALVLKGLTKGVFVTTSRFQSGASKAVETFETKGYKIELVDSEKLFEFLSITNRNFYKSKEELIQIMPENIDLELVHRDGYGRDDY